MTFSNRIDRSKARKLIESGLTNIEVAQVLGCTKQQIPELKRELGLPVASRPPRAEWKVRYERQAAVAAKPPKGKVVTNGGGIRIAMLSRADDAGRPRDRLASAQSTLPLAVIPRRRQAPVVENPGAVRFDALVAGQCRWIPGETVRGHAHESMACGDKVAGPGCPWCASHTERARGRVVGSVEGLSGIDRSAFRAVRVA